MRVFAVVVVHNPDMPTSGNQRKLEFWKKMGYIPNKSTEKFLTLFFPGGLVTRTGNWEIFVVSGRVGMYDNHTWQPIVFNSNVQT